LDPDSCWQDGTGLEDPEVAAYLLRTYRGGPEVGDTAEIQARLDSIFTRNAMNFFFNDILGVVYAGQEGRLYYHLSQGDIWFVSFEREEDEDLKDLLEELACPV
jgi:hypothetical protein